MRTVADRLAA